MNKILFSLLLCLPFAANAQFVVGAQGMTIQNGATVSIDSFVLQPTVDLTIASNQIQRSASSVVINSGNSVGRIYSFANPISYTGTMGFYYRDAELGSNTESGLQVATSVANTGSVWITTTGSVVNTSANYVSKTFLNTTISRLTATSATVPLPVTIISFDARKSQDQQTGLLSWEVANQLDIDQYEIERSIDARTFGSLGYVAASNQSNYSFPDNHPENGINYYRLQMKEKDGSKSYSAVRTLTFGANAAVLNVYPNPMMATVTISTTDATLSGTSGTVIDIAGRVIKSFTISGINTTLDVSALRPGNYLIRLENGQAFKVEKL